MEIEEKAFSSFIIAMAVPLGLMLVPLWSVLWAPKEYHALLLICALVALVVSMGVRISKIAGTFRKLANYRLGYYGERAVAEHLEPLLAQGYHVFHDVPASRGKAKFNLDHVTVGRTGIVVFETKARRKKRGRPGYDEHKMIFDGKKLIFPWGEETGAVEQAVDNVNWLRTWLKERTGREFPVAGMLMLPGWYVTEKARGAVRVGNPGYLLPNAVTGGKEVLSAADVELVAGQLMSVCRDVEPW